MEGSMLQQVAPQQDTYAQCRATGLHNVESTGTRTLGGHPEHAAEASRSDILEQVAHDNEGRALKWGKPLIEPQRKIERL
ncbi:hypothetical protein MLD38_038166 [Melastoma candidum]|uniref:Uncharacterized protein n=1 Tax=Melastoma candidum TaxID=119954 RepID=A0ACB9KY27_9MYRT|nr:hypothetical protein MLD38_038166 [Melastoma candidum]